MLKPEEVTSLFERQLAIAKEFIKGGNIVPTVDPNSLSPIRPEMWVGYNFSCNHRERMLPHIETGEFADALFRHRAPNQTEEEFQYVRNNYKQTTLTPFLDLDNNVGRAMSPGNWSIEFMEGAEAFRTYVTEGIREWGSVESFIQHALTSVKIADAMGLITTAPTELDVVETEDGVFVDPVIQVRPDIIYTSCEDVWGFDYDRWYLIRLDETVKLSNTERGLVCWMIDDTNIYRIEQTGKLRDWTFNTTIEYAHNQGQPPCIHMMGVPSVKRGKLVWVSPFAPAVEHLDIVLSNTQYLQVAVVKSMYPQPVMVGDQCEYVDPEHAAMCLNGWINWTGTEGEVLRAKCSSCNGTGRKSRLGPFNELVIIPDSGMDGKSNGINASNALAYVSAPTDGSRFTGERINYHMKEARKVIHLDAGDAMAGGDAKTATEAGINRKSQQAFVKPIVLQEFKIFDFILEMMAGYFGIEKEKAYTLTPPVSFDIRTPEEMLVELSQAITQGLPPATIEYLSWQYTSAKFKGDRSAIEAFDSIAKADRFNSAPWAMVTSEAAAGRAQTWEVFLHYGSLYVYELLASEDEMFVTLDSEEKAVKMQDKAKELANNAAPANNALGKLAQLTKVA